MNLPQGCHLGLGLWLHICHSTKITTAQHSSLGLFRLKELAESTKELFWICVVVTEEGICRNVQKLRESMES